MILSPDDQPPSEAIAPEILHDLCLRLRTEGRFEEALERLAVSPCSTVSLLALRAQLLNDMERYEEALSACWEARTLEDNHPAALFAQGFALVMLRQLEEAGIVLDALMEREPTYPDAAWLRASTLRKRFGDCHIAVLEAYVLTLSVAPDNLHVRMEHGDILRALGRYAEARDAYRQILAEGISEDALRADVWFRFGCVAMALNETDTARAAFCAVLEIAPDYPDAQALSDLLNSEV